MEDTRTHWSDGEEVVPEPYYYGLLEFLWKRFTGWEDSYGRKAQFIGF